MLPDRKGGSLSRGLLCETRKQQPSPRTNLYGIREQGTSLLEHVNRKPNENRRRPLPGVPGPEGLRQPFSRAAKATVNPGL
jgi:hypothetical protein